MHFLSLWPFVSKWPNTYIDKTSTYFIEYFICHLLYFFWWTKTGVYYFVTKAKAFVHKACPFRLWQVVGVPKKISVCCSERGWNNLWHRVVSANYIFQWFHRNTAKYVAWHYALYIQSCELCETPNTEQKPHNPVVLSQIAEFVNVVLKLRCDC